MFIAHEQRGSPRRSSSGLPLCVALLPLHVHRPPRAVLAVVAQCSACVRPRCLASREGMGKLVRRPHAPPKGAVIFPCAFRACVSCARLRIRTPHPYSVLDTQRAPASSQPTAGAACGASPHTAHAFGPPPSTRGMLVLGMRPRAVPRVFPPSPFHVPPAWSVSSSLGSLLTYAPVPFLRVACPPGRP